MGTYSSKVLDDLNGFCGNSSVYPYIFWRDSVAVSYKSDRVDVSLCFQDTAIFYSIVIVFWLLSIVRFFFAGNANIPPVPFNIINLAKCVICGIIIIPAVCDLAHSASSHIKVPFLYMTPSVLIVAMVLAAISTAYERKIGIRSSGHMIVFWIAMVVYGTIKLRTYILLKKDGRHDNFRFKTLITEYVLFIVQLLLSLILEPPSPYHSYRDGNREPCPEKSAHFFSKTTWWWQNGLFWRGFRKALTYDDLCDLNYEEKSQNIVPKFQKDWDQQLRKAGIVFNQNDGDGVPVTTRRGEPSLVMALAKSFGFTFFVAAFFKVANDLLSFVSPQLLKLMIAYVNYHSDQDAWRGYAYTFLMFFAAILQSLCIHYYFHLCFRVGMRVRTSIIATVYAKALRLSNAARRNSTVGEIVNLMSVDAQRLMDLATYFHYLWSGLFQIILALFFLYQTMGASVFAGFGVMLLLIPVNAGIAIISRKFQVRQMIKKDARIKLVNEVLNGIKVIKLYAWEIPFKRLIMGIREDELKILKASQYLNAATAFTWTCAPFMVALVTFATYSLYYKDDPDKRLTADKAFVALSLFNILRFPLSMLPMTVSMFVEATVSVKRLCKFLKEDELDPSSIEKRQEPAGFGEESISVSNGSFTWDTPERPTLANVNFKAQSGELVAVVGHVGAGKSSLISAMLGEMDKLNGNATLRGRVAYVPQQAWIQNATVKDNILFNRHMNGLLYDRVINACALAPDFDILPGGDMTEIGEKGINLSGGQKQRVSLARAVYQEADIYLLDDPLSAVDSHVGKHIFDKVIGPEGILKNKVRVLVTHGLGFLPQCDKIVVMDEGKITEVGSYNELVDQDGAFAEFLRNYATREENEEGDPVANEYVEYEDEIEDEADPVSTAFSDDPDSLTRTQGALAKRRARLKSSDSELKGVDGWKPELKRGISRPELKRGTSRTELKRQLSKQSSVISQTDVDKAGATENTKLIQEESVETGNVKIRIFLAYAKACTYLMSVLLCLFYVFTNGASVGQNIWLAHWSDANDNSKLGENLGVYAALGLSQALFVLVGSFVLAIGGVLGSRKLHDSMLATIMRAPMAFFDTTPLGRILNRFSKDIYTIDEAIPRSLRFFISTFFAVLSTIIVIAIASPWFLAVIVPLLILYIVIQRFYIATSRQLKRLESVTRSPIYSHFQESITGAPTIRAYNRTEDFKQQSEEKVDYNQIAYYPGICANRWLAIRLEFVGNLIILFAALFATLQANYPSILGRINPGLVGLSISYALQVTAALNWMVRMTSELETNIVSVERTKEYAEAPTEAPDIIEHNRPPSNWPIEGRIKFDHYATRYREGLDLVLKNISCDISGGQKVGIVGRTGAGKSSLTLALFRIIESASGAIFIDGVNIAGLGLSDLRSRITIIPQDPVLFSGTLRINLDPFDHHSDNEIWRALETAHLIQFVQNLPARLEYEIAEGGENLSVGQRQLVCLARALLRKTKVLVLDEATAAVDLETDDLIQKTIRKEFAESTVVTIAHRLNTIMDYDRIMVLDTGRIVEFDSPNVLLEKKGQFYGMAQDAGIV